MDVGDKKPPFEPVYRPTRCDVSGYEFTPGAVRSCPEPHVIAKYGVGGKCKVSVYICRKCRYHADVKWIGGVKCEYMAKSKAL